MASAAAAKTGHMAALVLVSAAGGLLYITRAYNRKEITFEEWLLQPRQRAERIIQQRTTKDNQQPEQ